MATAVGSTLEVGTTVGNHRLIAPLGRGGMAEVFAARHLKSGRVHALKALRCPASTSRQGRFRREYTFLSRLSHPHILKAYGFGCHGPTYYYVIELADGGRLRDLYGGPAPSWLQLIDHAMQLCSALIYLHDRRIVHRDIKPTNLLVNIDGDLRLADFGLAVDLELGDQPAQTRRLHGTLSYASPEQARGRPVEPRSDLYSLGVTLFELSTGHRPFVAESPREVLVQHVLETPLAPKELRPDMPDGLQALILALMEKSPWRRPRGGRAVLGALQEIRRQLSSPVGRASGLEQARHWTPSR